jgi:hypothetical protein
MPWLGYKFASPPKIKPYMEYTSQIKRLYYKKNIKQNAVLVIDCEINWFSIVNN